MSYRFALSRGSRAGGQSAAAKFAYHERLDDYAVGREGVRDDLTATGSGNLPAFAQGDPSVFWDAVDGYERANACLFIDVQLGLPWELSAEQQQQALRAYLDRMFSPLRLPYSWAIHADDHVHLMFSERMTDDFDRLAEGHFKRYNEKHPERGGVQKTRDLQSTEWLISARAAWAEEVNKVLVEAGHEPYYDHRSLQAQRNDALERGLWRKAAELNRPVEEHEGPRIAGMRRRLERGEVELADLPQYAQIVIQGNDLIRAENAAYMRRIARMSDDELRLMQADDIQRLARERLTGKERIALAALERELQDEQLDDLLAVEHTQAHAAALAEDAERGVAAAQQAGELELLAAAQIEAAERTAIAAELGELIEQEQGDHLGDLLAIEREQAHGAALVEGAQRERTAIAAELGALVSSEALDVTRQRLAIEREQAHSAALIDDAEHERLAFLDVMQKWGAHLGERPEVAQVHALADRLRAGDTGANGAAKELALSLRSAERARQAALEQEEKERQRRAELEVLRRQRVAGMQAEREQQRQAEQDRQVAPSPAPRSGLPAEPEAPETRALERRGGDEWVEFEEGGERYRHPAGRPDEIYWQNPSGEWHLQPDEPEVLDYDNGYDYR